MYPHQTIEKYLVSHARCPASPELQDIVMELRSLIAAVAPSASEVIHPYGLTYYDVARGGPVSAGICQISLYPDHIRLGFVHGAFLPDPEHLLVGDRIAKRYVPIYSYQQAPWGALEALIRASAALDPRRIETDETAEA